MRLPRTDLARDPLLREHLKVTERLTEVDARYQEGMEAQNRHEPR